MFQAKTGKKDAKHRLKKRKWEGKEIKEKPTFQHINECAAVWTWMFPVVTQQYQQGKEW